MHINEWERKREDAGVHQVKNCFLKKLNTYPKSANHTEILYPVYCYC